MKSFLNMKNNKKARALILAVDVPAALSVAANFESILSCNQEDTR